MELSPHTPMSQSGFSSAQGLLVSTGSVCIIMLQLPTSNDGALGVVGLGHSLVVNRNPIFSQDDLKKKKKKR